MQPMGGNTFFTNAEAYAFEVLQQRLMKEAQRSAQQTVMELSALKTFFGQGHLLYCIPVGGGPHPGLPLAPLPCLPYPEPVCLPPAPPPPPPQPPPMSTGIDVHRSPPLPLCHSPAANGYPSPCANASSPSAPSFPPQQQSTVRVNIKSPQAKHPQHKPGSDECNLGKDGIDVTIDLRPFLPAEISLDVEEKSVEIKATHSEPQGCKTFARRYELPACIILDSVRCILTHDGFLLFSAAWCKME